MKDLNSEVTGLNIGQLAAVFSTFRDPERLYILFFYPPGPSGAQEASAQSPFSASLGRYSFRSLGQVSKTKNMVTRSGLEGRPLLTPPVFSEQ